MRCTECHYFSEIAHCLRHGASGECWHPTTPPARRFRMGGGCSRAPSAVAQQWAKDSAAAKQERDIDELNRLRTKLLECAAALLDAKGVPGTTEVLLNGTTRWTGALFDMVDPEAAALLALVAKKEGE
jgi:hypothetical protein